MSVQEFVLNFFKSMKAEITENDGVFCIDKVKEFESYYGRKAPYFFVFEREAGDNQEKIDKTNPLMKIISEFLSKKGQTSLVKLDFNIEREDILKMLRFKNCELTSITKNAEYDYFVRFTFQTNFQFLNDREQLVSSIFVDKGKIIDFNPEKYPCKEGRKQDLAVEDVKAEYALAKNEVRKLIGPKITKISDYLTKKLERETARIKEHFKARKEEINAIKDLIKAEDERIKSEREEEFFLKDEEHKHGLDISTNLINTSIFYYPIFRVSLWLKNSMASGRPEVVYNPLTKQLVSVRCPSCNTELDKISLCSSGHAACCMDSCGECKKDFCTKCLDKKCSYCGKSVCSKCAEKCLKCGKYYCSSHMKQDSHGKKSCINCLSKCLGCGVYTDKMNKCSCSKEYCDKCWKAFPVINGRKLCNHCYKICFLCGKPSIKSDFERCCKAEFCNFPGKCLSCRKQLCNKLKSNKL